MKEAAADERFEDAARYRNRLFAVQHLLERQTADRRAVGSADVIGFAVEGDHAAVQLFPMRDGKLIDRYAFHLENVGEQETSRILEAFCLEYYGSAPSVPPQLLVPPEAGDTSVLEAFLTEERGARVEVRAPERGEKRRLVELAVRNARYALESESLRHESRRQRRVEALEELREALNLESLPLRIECYDISNLQEAEPVAAMVVFEDGVPRKAHYRKFAIRGLGGGQDDFAAMGEVIARRFARLAEVDNGARRLRRELRDHAEPRRHRRREGPARRRARRDAGLRPAAGRRHLAGQEDRGGVRPRPRGVDPPRPAQPRAAAPAADPRRGAPLRARLPPPAPRRDLAADDLRRAAGCGPARRRAILQHFGSPDRFVAASQEELEGVPGLPAKTARAIYAQLHKTGRA